MIPSQSSASSDPQFGVIACTALHAPTFPAKNIVLKMGRTFNVPHLCPDSPTDARLTGTREVMGGAQEQQDESELSPCSYYLPAPQTDTRKGLWASWSQSCYNGNPVYSPPSPPWVKVISISVPLCESLLVSSIMNPCSCDCGSTSLLMPIDNNNQIFSW